MKNKEKATSFARNRIGVFVVLILIVLVTAVLLNKKETPKQSLVDLYDSEDLSCVSHFPHRMFSGERILVGASPEIVKRACGQKARYVFPMGRTEKCSDLKFAHVVISFSAHQSVDIPDLIKIIQIHYSVGCISPDTKPAATDALVLCFKATSELIEWLYARLDIMDIMGLPPATLLNDAASIVMGTAGFPLRGEGQWVSVADSGIDEHRCEFPSGTLTVLKEHSVPPPVKADEIHGTFVTAQLAGRGSHDVPAGLAPGANVLFQTLNATMPTFYMKQALELNSSVNSFSWGSYPAEYSDRECVVDRFLFKQDSIVAVFGAGNQGPGSSSLTREGSLQNAIVVGGSHSTPDKCEQVGRLSTESCFLASDQNCMASYLNELWSCRSTMISQSWMWAGSSVGPTLDGRIKPDLVAPSAVRSAAANEMCPNLMVQQGTSMATPMIAALATIVRQYFIEGFYPTGSKVKADSFIPTSSTIKALMIASAEPVRGPVLRTRYLLEWLCGLDGNQDFRSHACPWAPSHSSGFGRPDVARMLPMTPSFGLFVYQSSDPMSHDEKLLFEFPLQNCASVDIALSYNDPCTSVEHPILENDLDLSVFYAGRWWSGNFCDEPDNRNNAEVVRLHDASAGLVQVLIHARHITHVRQPFSLVIRGDVQRDNVSVIVNPPITNDPSRPCSISPQFSHRSKSHAFPTCHGDIPFVPIVEFGVLQFIASIKQIIQFAVVGLSLAALVSFTFHLRKFAKARRDKRND